MKQKTVREVALDLIIRVEKDAGYSHLIVSDAIQRTHLEKRDEALLTEIVYGTINWKITLDYYLSDYLKNQKKIESWVIHLLRMSVYQMVFLDRVPTFAIINEAVIIAKKKGHKGIASLVNAVLRRMDRKGIKDITLIDDKIEQLSIATSHPQALIERWIEIYGFTETKEICNENQKTKQMFIRINLTKTTVSEVTDRLQAIGFKFEYIPFIPEALRILEGNILKTDLIDQGLVTIQDLSSMLAAAMLEVEKEMTVLDACSAPGGKTTFISERMKQTGNIFAYDIHRKKIKMVEQHARRLGLENIRTGVHDARQLNEVFDINTFDRILLDVPCSGFGVIRSKPDIKYSKSINDIERLSEIQYDILTENAKLLNKNGKLVYSTCTIEKKENEEVIERFLELNPSFKIDENFIQAMQAFDNIHISEFGVQILPHSFHSDGFFISRLVYESV